MTNAGVNTFLSFVVVFLLLFFAAILILIVITRKTTAARQKFGFFLLIVLIQAAQQWLGIIGTFSLVRVVLIFISFCLMGLTFYRWRKDKPLI